MPSRKVGVIGATGAVGQRFVTLLAEHPWFDLVAVAASERSAGRRYAEACRWVLDDPMPDAVAEQEVQRAGDPIDADILFSAVPGGHAGDMERSYAAGGHAVFSNARDNRRVDGIPLVITEVNPEFYAMLDDRRGEGFVVTNGNCSGIVATLALTPLHERFGLQSAHIVTYQALSGAGHPGVPSLDIMDNIVPHIGGEEDKLENEPPYVWGEARRDGTVTRAQMRISATCVRVPVTEGHSMAIHASFEKRPTVSEAREAVAAWRGKIEGMGLPSSVERPVMLEGDPNGPQPRRARNLGGGMGIAVGRLREDPLMQLKFFASGSNTIRGAAGQSLLNAEYAVRQGYC